MTFSFRNIDDWLFRGATRDLCLQGHVIIGEWIEYVSWILWPRKPYSRHQNYICTIYSSWEKWTCMICRPSWTPSWISQNCQGLRGDTIIFLETGDLRKRLTPMSYLYHFAAHGTSFFKHLLLHYNQHFTTFGNEIDRLNSRLFGKCIEFCSRFASAEISEESEPVI